MGGLVAWGRGEGVRRIPILGLVLALALPRAAPALTLTSGFASSSVATGLVEPTAARFAPDGRLFILEKAGCVRLWKPATGLVATPVLTLPSCEQSEMGLLGLAFDPAFATNGRLYLYHTQPPGGDTGRCNTPAGRENRIVRVTVTGDTADASTLQVLFRGIHTDGGNHDGGNLEIGPDGFLYAGVGDSGVGDHGSPGASTNPYAQDRTVPNGKILRLTLDGAGAPGNPFAGQGGASDAVFAYGLRNPWRFTFQPGTKLLWVADVGQITWEEIDVVHAGDNLGWPQCEAREPHPPCPGSTVPPVHQYNHDGRGASITGGVFYDGSQFPSAFRGSYFFADYIIDVIWRAVPTAANDGFDGPPQVFGRNAGAPVDFTVGPDGALYYVAFAEGEVRKITHVESGAARDPCAARLGRALPAFVRGAGRIVERCTRRDGAACASLPLERLRPATTRLARAIARRCAMPPDELCARLGCAACAGAVDLAACAAVVGPPLDVARQTIAAGTDACTATAFSAALTLAVARARCHAHASGACTDGHGVPARLARRVARRCASPPEALCQALGCEACAAASDLATCLDATVASSVDGLAFRVYGSG